MDRNRRRILAGMAGTAVTVALGMARPVKAADSRLTVIRHIRPESDRDPRNRYFLDLLTLALNHTVRRDGPFRLEPVAVPIPQSRAIAELAAGKQLDVVWTMATRERESVLLPVRIPLLKGLMGYRIFIVRAGDEPRFAGIHDIAGLGRLVAVQGHDWPDADILAANGLPVVRSESYEGLFGMLALGRADYFPRALNEPWSELAALHHQGLAVEPRLLLRYTADNYFFVNPHNTALAERIERGLRAAMADGSFERLFRRHPANATAFAKANLAARRIIDLHNPLLSPQTPLHDKSLWFHLD